MISYNQILSKKALNSLKDLERYVKYQGAEISIKRTPFYIKVSGLK